MRSSPLPGAALLVTIACTGPTAPEIAPEAVSPAQGVDPAAEARAAAAVDQLGKRLKERLVTTMQAEGPVAAMALCATQAQPMTREVAETSGVRVGRSSLRLRNPKNAPPDWVGAWLVEQGERPAEGVEGRVRAATRADGTAVVRVLEPLAIQPPCLTCHGPPEAQLPDLTAALAERYPDDKAVGYALGDLRGAIWAEAVVAP